MKLNIDLEDIHDVRSVLEQLLSIVTASCNTALISERAEVLCKQYVAEKEKVHALVTTLKVIASEHDMSLAQIRTLALKAIEGARGE